MNNYAKKLLLLIPMVGFSLTVMPMGKNQAFFYKEGKKGREVRTYNPDEFPPLNDHTRMHKIKKKQRSAPSRKKQRHSRRKMRSSGEPFMRRMDHYVKMYTPLDQARKTESLVQSKGSEHYMNSLRVLNLFYAEKQIGDLQVLIRKLEKNLGIFRPIKNVKKIEMILNSIYHIIINHELVGFRDRITSLSKSRMDFKRRQDVVANILQETLNAINQHAQLFNKAKAYPMSPVLISLAIERAQEFIAMSFDKFRGEGAFLAQNRKKARNALINGSKNIRTMLEK